MHSRITAGLAAMGLAIGALLALPGPASAASPSYDVTFGATYTRGDLHWFNRSASVVGVQRSVSTSPGGCRKTLARTYTPDLITTLDTRTTTPVCGGSANITIPLKADVPGGAGWIEICLLDELGRVVSGKCRFYKR
ncbi:hypothetical protein ACFWBF_08800 [Streptomyces sp. NPDC060028]|uniref:hypothetical protein n=1 Tax=Streptomyces sp. NPDC060028 TaxID=3347041 RepID=UPI0036895F5B